MNYSYFPIQVRQCEIGASTFVAADQVVPTNPDPVSPCKLIESEIEVRVGFQIYAMTLMTVIGWFLLAVFLPTGMQGIPFDLAAQWVNRPRPMNESDFNYAKAELAKKV